MAVDMFLKIQGIRGESQDSKHKDEIEVLSFSWGVSNAPRSSSGIGRPSSGQRTTRISDFSIQKYVDTASPQLFEYCCTGQHIQDVSFVARKAGKEQLEYYKIKLSDVLISSVQNGASTGDLTSGAESVSFSFGTAQIYAAEQKPDGSLGEFVESTCGGSSEEPIDVIIEKK